MIYTLRTLHIDIYKTRNPIILVNKKFCHPSKYDITRGHNQ